jgi:hypothetical protein
MIYAFIVIAIPPTQELSTDNGLGIRLLVTLTN